MKYGILFVVMVIFVFAGLSFAESGFDDQGNPNDPNINPRANACFEGGAMEFVCDTEEEWGAGWYLIRLQFGLISRENFPAIYEWILAEEATPASTEAVIVLPTSTPLPK